MSSRTAVARAAKAAKQSEARHTDTGTAAGSESDDGIERSYNPCSKYEEHTEIDGLTLFEINRPPRAKVEGRDETRTIAVRTLNTELTCPICLGIMRNAQVVKHCLHRFCGSCIQKCLRLGKMECPACRHIIATRRDLRADAQLDALIGTIYPDLDEYEAREQRLLEAVNQKHNINNSFTRACTEGMIGQYHRNNVRPPNMAGHGRGRFNARPVPSGLSAEATRALASSSSSSSSSHREAALPPSQSALLRAAEEEGKKAGMAPAVRHSARAGAGKRPARSAKQAAEEGGIGGEGGEQRKRQRRQLPTSGLRPGGLAAHLQHAPPAGGGVVATHAADVDNTSFVQFVLRRHPLEEMVGRLHREHLRTSKEMEVSQMKRFLAKQLPSKGLPQNWHRKLQISFVAQNLRVVLADDVTLDSLVQFIPDTSSTLVLHYWLPPNPRH